MRVPSSPAPRSDRTDGVHVDIATDHCVGCLACADVCGPGALRLLDGGAWAVQADTERCSVCRRCESACPFGAISVEGRPRTPHRMVTEALRAALRDSCPGGWQAVSPGPAFRLGAGHPTVTPDVAIVRADPPAVSWLEPQGSPVALVVEVLPAKRHHANLDQRSDLYHRCGVTAYWTVDQRSGAVTVRWARARSWFDSWARAVFA